MPEEQNRGMESTLSLLSGAQKYLDQENLFFAKNKISLNMHLTDKLCKKINFLRNHDHYTSIIEKFFCKEVAARLLSLGICLTSLIDTILQITSIATKISLTVVEKLILHKNITSSNMNMFYKVLLSEIRDLFIHIFGIIIGPVIGLISPDHGLQIANPKSTLFDAIRFSGENPEKAILSDVNSLSLGQSILLPLSFRVRDSGHIVYCLIENTPEGYHFSTINTGYGTDFASTRLKTLAYRKNHLEIDFNDCESSNSPKYVANYTFRKLSKEQLTTHIKSIQKLAQKSFDDIKKEAKEKKTSKYTYTMSILYPAKITAGNKTSYPEFGVINNGKADLTQNPNLMFYKPQSIGDCPKSSLLAALNYHCSHSNGEINYQPYDKWIRSLKEQILNEDGYLIDMSVNLRNIDRGAFRAARDELDKNWSSYYSKYPIE